MKFLQDILKVLQGFGVNLSPRVLTLLLIGVPLLITAAAAVVAWYLARKRDKATKKVEPPPVEAPGAKAPTGVQLSSYQLLMIWWRFLRRLPASYRRSILNFEQFIVLGAAQSGKSALIERYTDWQRHTKQLVGDMPQSPDLQIYLASECVVLELPARILEDFGDRSRAALANLWRPLFSRRAPSIVVCVDVIRLRQATPDVVREMAEALRGKINQLSSIRRKGLEVRVVLTHLDEIEGFAEFGAFCRKAGISRRIQLAPAPKPLDPRAELEAWFEDTRGQLPRALVSMQTKSLRAIITFLRKVPELYPSLTHLLSTLFAHEPLAYDPVRGGIYLSSDPPGLPNPLRSAMESGPGPDPRRWHMITAGLLGGACVTYMGLAYRAQDALWTPADAAMSQYIVTPDLIGQKREVRLREEICNFTIRSKGWLELHPGFFAEARKEMRAKLSERIRDDLLLPEFRRVAIQGTVRDDEMSLPWRRSLYYLALIHSDMRDRLKILDPTRTAIWSSMTGLGEDIISDYIENTDVALRRPVDFDLGERDVTAPDTAGYWTGLLDSIQNALSDGLITPQELEAMKALAAILERNLDRFTHDDITTKILPELDDAAAGDGADRGDRAGSPVLLLRTYQPKYGDFIQSITSAGVSRQIEQLKSVLRTVRSTTIEVPEPQSLRELTGRLQELAQSAEPAGGATDGEAIQLKLATQTLAFDKRRWAEVVRNSKASQYINGFIRRDSAQSIFFVSGDDAELAPVVWNPYSGPGSIFTGRGELDGRNTAAAYNKFVRGAIEKLAQTLEKTQVPEEQKQQLREAVRGHVAQYANDYRAQVDRFYQSFGLRAPSAEALRVALAQMVADTSIFADFLGAMVSNTHLDAEGPMLAPMKEALREYTQLHEVVNPAKGAPPLNNYKAILGALLADLGTTKEAEKGVAAAPPDPGKPADNETLQEALTPSGKLALADMRREKGSYSLLVDTWLGDVRLPASQHAPFIAPLRELFGSGRADVERVVSRVWQMEVVPDLQRILQRFPFDQTSRDDATPEELTEVFHPTEGRFFNLFRRYIEPLTALDGGPFRELPGVRGLVQLPRDMYPCINKVAALSARLWDETGKPLLIPVRVATLSFERQASTDAALTLVYLNVGDTAVFNFNQKPAWSDIRLDWTKRHNAQIGVQLTNVESRENEFPEPLAVQNSFWSFYRLVRLATVSPVREPPDGLLHTWSIPRRRGGSEKLRGSFVVRGDIWSPFRLGKKREGVR